MLTSLEIVQIALVKIEEKIITSFDTPDILSQRIKLLFNTALCSEISANLWSFAKWQASLPRLNEVPPFKWSYYYQQPADFLTLYDIEGASLPVQELRTRLEVYDLMGDKIVTNIAGPLNITYVRKMPDTSKYPYLFANVLACRLARELAPQKYRPYFWQEYERELMVAINNNAVQLPPRRIPDGEYMTERY